MNEIQRLQKEVSEMVSVIDNIWCLRQMKRFIINITRDTEYETLVLEKGGVADE